MAQTAWSRGRWSLVFLVCRQKVDHSALAAAARPTEKRHAGTRSRIHSCSYNLTHPQPPSYLGSTPSSPPLWEELLYNNSTATLPPARHLSIYPSIVRSTPGSTSSSLGTMLPYINARRCEPTEQLPRVLTTAKHSNMSPTCWGTRQMSVSIPRPALAVPVLTWCPSKTCLLLLPVISAGGTTQADTRQGPMEEELVRHQVRLVTLIPCRASSAY